MTEESILYSPTTGYSRKVWYLPSATGAPTKIGLFLDGEYYVNRMDAPLVIRDLETRAEIQPMASVFVSHLDAAARHVDLTCNPRFTAFLLDDVLPWICARNPGAGPGGHLIAGTSLSGLAASEAALRHPDKFAQCLAHSGSFWWNREWLRARIAESPPARGRWWVSVGTKETQVGISHPPSGLLQEVGQKPACEHFAQALRERGDEVHFHLFEGGHDMNAWKAELPDALRWLAG